MECNYAAPLSDPSNAEFQRDIVNWSKVSNRIFIWDYITSFANYIIPFPNCAWCHITQSVSCQCVGGRFHLPPDPCAKFNMLYCG
jgi:hypothetical protein